MTRMMSRTSIAWTRWRVLRSRLWHDRKVDVTRALELAIAIATVVAGVAVVAQEAEVAIVGAMAVTVAAIAVAVDGAGDKDSVARKDADDAKNIV